MSSADISRADPVLDRLKGLHPKIIDLSLERMERLLAALGHPERQLPPVVHVAGTNGKGSTLAFLRAILEAAGLRVHVYTSPHLVRFNERIRLAGQLIPDDRLAALLEDVESANAGQPITFFEVTTAAAFLAFAREQADVVLLETGLGGRLDATNMVDRPAVTAITRISYDHRQYLGETLSAIAGEKAGIMRQGVPVLWAHQPDDEAAACLTSKAAEVGALVQSWQVIPGADGFRFESDHRKLDLPLPGLPGGHQIGNAGLAIACLDHLPFTISNEAVVRGLQTVEWPARLQKLNRGPLADSLPSGWQLWLDGGHNDSAGEVLAVQAAHWAAGDGLPLLMIHGMLTTKTPEEFLGPLACHVSAYRAVAIPDEPASFSAEDAAAAARNAGMPDPKPSVDVTGAMAELIAAHSGPARVLICGSLYLAGTVLADNG